MAPLTLSPIPTSAPGAEIPFAEIPFAEKLAERAVPLGFPAPHPRLRACVVVPARDEAEAMPALLAALAGQRDLHGAPLPADSWEVLLLLNNGEDDTAAVIQGLRPAFPRLTLRVAELCFPAAEAHVGRARQVLFDTAFRRFQSLRRPEGLILTTDADSRPAPDWIAQNVAEIAAGVDGVGGRIVLDPAERAGLPAEVRRLLLLDIGWRRALEELRDLYAPEAHDPFPRHHQHFGASLALTAAAYERAGGLPLRRSSEDVALFRALVEAGGRFRHSYRVRVQTSARMQGRAQGGLADALQWWDGKARAATAVEVESAAAAEERLARLGLWCAEHPGAMPPPALNVTPEAPRSGACAEIHATLRELRVLIAGLRARSLAERLAEARARFGGGREE